MPRIPTALRRRVIERARGRCEYCRLSQIGQEAEFHIDHVVPQDAGGRTAIQNLALACVSCSLRKAAREIAIDPDTRRRAPIFNPRTQTWREHFRWNSVVLVGRTPTGRATIAALKMNRPLILAIRTEELARGRHPPR